MQRRRFNYWQGSSSLFCGSWLPFQWNLTLFGADDAEYACAITLLLKIIPFLIIVGIVASLAFCRG